MVDLKPTQITDHEQGALDSVAVTIYNETDLETFTRILATQTQEIEDAFYDLLTKRWIDSAEGAQLDIIGDILKTTRSGYSDDIYRIRIKAAIIRYTSLGRIEDLIAAFALLTQAEKVLFKGVFPAKIRLIAYNATAPVGTETEIRAAIEGAVAAGVGIESLVITNDTPFVFFGNPNPNGKGFGSSISGYVGGNFAKTI